MRKAWCNLFIIGFSIVTLFFQNCQDMGSFKALKPTNQASFDFGDRDFNELSPEEQSLYIFLQKLKINLSASCRSSSDSHSCIFYKNPFEQTGSSLNFVPHSLDQLSDLQIHSIQIEGTDNQGFLRNTNFDIYATSAPRININNQADLKYSIDSTGAKQSQIASYHWLQLTNTYLNEFLGTNYLKNRQLQVDAFNSDSEIHNNATYNYSTGRITMGVYSSSLGVVSEGLAVGALSHESVVHEYTHGQQHGAATDSLSILGTNEKTCGSEDKSLCCITKEGCRRAMQEGQADYLAQVMFVDRSGPMLADISNNPNGMEFCSGDRSRTFLRNLASNFSLTADMAFSSCPNNAVFESENVNGDIYRLSALYASIWWEIRMKFKSQPLKQKKLDQLFMEHLKVMNSEDNFVTMLPKIKALDSTFFNNDYSAFFDQEYLRRGL